MMKRVQLASPDKFIFSTDFPVRVDDINYGQHLSNDAVLRLAHEARIQFLGSIGYTELDIAGVSLIMIDAQVQYLRQAFHGHLLRISLAVTDCSRIGFQLFYSIFNLSTNEEVAKLTTNMVFFDYKTQKTGSTPKEFIEKLSGLSLG